VSASPPPLRIYASVRTAHLERFREMEPAVVLFHRARYDYDESLADPQWRPRRMGRRGVIAELVRHPYRVVEVNEPIMTDRWLDLLAQILVLRLRGLLTRRRTPVVAYCIGLTDPAEEIRRRLPVPVPLWCVRLWCRLVMSLVVAGTDRLAFGTSGARDLYGLYVPAHLLARRARVFEALPRPCGCDESVAERSERGRTVLFLGAFNERKGIDLTMRAWEALSERDPSLHFHVIGKGDARDRVESWTAGRSDVLLEIDPPRARIHAALRDSAVLVLLSQRVGPWREQVGLPIVEALAHGCTVVTTDETGLADWLARHGHLVVPSLARPDQVADAIATALRRGRPESDVLADLPATDSRIAADEWLLAAGDGRYGPPIPHAPA
jgi:glycosyltransferase involved in cell wall biosynthesis